MATYKIKETVTYSLEIEADSESEAWDRYRDTPKDKNVKFEGREITEK